jgi:quercetin dioxygenase-like cupin family protein
VIITRRSALATASVRPAATFTGEVWRDSRLRDKAIIVNDVFFAPTARTHWHRHEHGQVLIVTHGFGLVHVKGEPSSPIGPSDMVYFPAGEEHWHGAGPETYLVHTAISLGETDWMDPVSADEYDGALRSCGGLFVEEWS